MAKPARTPLDKILTLKTNLVAKLFFLNYFTPGIITKILHPAAWEQAREKTQQGFVMPYIRDCLKEWQTAGFIEISPIKIAYWVEKKGGKRYPLENYGYRLNLEPLYLYCKQKHHIDFTEEEREVINKRVGIHVMRKRIFNEYPEDDIITAIIKFYIKQFAIPPLEPMNESHRRLLDRVEREVERDLKTVEANKLKIAEKLKTNPPSKDDKLVNVEQLIEERAEKQIYERFIDKKTGELKVSLEEFENYAKIQNLLLYATGYKKSPKVVSSINMKFKKALGII